MNAWSRRGLLYSPEPGPLWRTSHAANPVAVPSSGGWHVLFSSRDALNRSHIGALEFSGRDACSGSASIASEPLLRPGRPGSFDQHGVSAGCLAQEGRWLFYLGWNLDGPGTFNNTLGLAIRDETGGFTRASERPVLDLSEDDPHSLSYPWVLRRGEDWQLWYGSTVEWLAQGDVRHVIKRAVSRDGQRWQPTGEVCLEGDGVHDWALSRPCVLAGANGYRMWFSARGERYRIGYAESEDGVSWSRDDAQWGLGVGQEPWEDEEVAYPCVYAHEGQLFLFYCGNGYGRTGFGLAVADDPWALSSRPTAP
ncbi:MAG: hypothetical protein AAF690_09240 [Acidobacteriota bacterium]